MLALADEPGPRALQGASRRRRALAVERARLAHQRLSHAPSAPRVLDERAAQLAAVQRRGRVVQREQGPPARAAPAACGRPCTSAIFAAGSKRASA